MTVNGRRTRNNDGKKAKLLLVDVVNQLSGNCDSVRLNISYIYHEMKRKKVKKKKKKSGTKMTASVLKHDPNI